MFTVTAPDKQAHAEGIFDLVAEQWRDDLREQCREGRIFHSHYDWRTSRVGLVDGKVVTHFGVYNLTVRVSSARVAAAGVNLVVTHPDYRKQGLMPKTIWSSIEAMRDRGYDISIVANAVENYYERFGWRAAWPETHYYIAPESLPNEKPSVRLRKWNTRSRPVLASLYNAENSELTGTALHPTFLRTKEPGELTGYLMLDDEGNTVGYIIYDILQGGKVLWHYKSAGDPTECLRAFAAISRKLEAEELRFNRLHYNSPLARKLRTLDCYSETKYNPSGGWMIQIINLRTLFEKLLPELSLRISHSHLSTWRGKLPIATRTERITLLIDRGSISLAKQATTQIPNTRLMAARKSPCWRWAQNWQTSSYSSAGTLLRGDGAELALALFPRQYPQMGNSDL